MTFWEHLEQLRSVILRAVITIFTLTIVAFCFKDLIFEVIFAPTTNDFPLCSLFQNSDNIAVNLINTQLTGQFMAHIQVAFYFAVVVGMPIVLWQIFRFVAPALYLSERQRVTKAMVAGLILFYIGILINYFLIFPLSFRFLYLYQISGNVENLIEISSYLDSMLVLSLMMGLLFELPLVCIFLARIGIFSSKDMKTYRRHVFVAILVFAAIITPTTDAFTLAIVSIPIYLLFEVSILFVQLRERKYKTLNG